MKILISPLNSVVAASDFDSETKNVANYMEARGYKLLGSGGAATVWHKRGEKNVVKVIEEYDAESPLVFVKWAKRQTSKHLPKIENITRAKIKHTMGRNEGRTLIYVMVYVEKLTELKSPQIKKARAVYLQIENIIQSSDDWKKKLKSLIAKDSEIDEYSKVMIQCILAANKKGLNLDLHDPRCSNIMARGNTLVINDPWSDELLF